MNGPCRDCDKRKLYCHSKCEEYKNWKIYIENANNNRREYIKNNYDSFTQHHRNENRIILY